MLHSKRTTNERGGCRRDCHDLVFAFLKAGSPAGSDERQSNEDWTIVRPKRHGTRKKKRVTTNTQEEQKRGRRREARRAWRRSEGKKIKKAIKVKKREEKQKKKWDKWRLKREARKTMKSDSEQKREKQSKEERRKRRAEAKARRKSEAKAKRKIEARERRKEEAEEREKMKESRRKERKEKREREKAEAEEMARIEREASVRMTESGVAVKESVCDEELSADVHEGPQRIVVGTWNVGTMTGKSVEVAEALAEEAVDVCCLQETRWKGQGARVLGKRGQGYKFFWQGSGRAEGGVGVMLKAEWADRVVSVDRLGERLIVLRMVVGGEELCVVSAYAPRLDGPRGRRKSSGPLLKAFWLEWGEGESFWCWLGT